MNKLISVFPNSDLRSSHRGLTLAAVKAKRKPPELLENGEFHLFLNRRQTAFKMLAANSTVVHYKSPRGSIDIRTIEYLPHCFNAGELDYDKALRIVLEKILRKKVK